MTDIIEWAARQVIEEQIAVLDGTDVASLPPALRIGIAAYGKATRGLLEDPSAVADFMEAREYLMDAIGSRDLPGGKALMECARTISEAMSEIRPGSEVVPQASEPPASSTSCPVREAEVVAGMADGGWRTWREVAGMFDWTAYPMPESAMRSCTRRVLRNLAKAGMMEEYPPYVRGAKVTDSTMWRRSP